MQSKRQSAYDFVKSLFTIILGLIVLGSFVVALGGYWFWEDLDIYHARFNNVRDLDTGRTVKFDGLDVGRVTQVQVDPDDPRTIKVSFGVEEGFSIYDGTVASISQKGLVGDNYLLLTLENNVGDKLKPGDSLPTNVTPTLNELGSTIGGFIEEIRPKFNRVADGLENLLSDQNTETVRHILLKAERLMDEGNSLVSLLEKDLQGVGPLAKSTLEHASQTFDKGTTVLDNVDRNFAHVSEDLREQLTIVSESVTSLSEELKESLSTDQHKLERVLDELYAMARDVRMLSRSLRERPYEIIYPPEPKP